MKQEEYLKAYETEETNWYFVSRRNFFFKLLYKYIENKNNKILDIGSGAGIILKELNRYGKAIGMDFSRKAVELCKLRGLDCIYGNANNIPFKDESFDIVSAFGVIEHVDNDKEVLREIVRVCKRNGFIIIGCPAYQFLWSQHDIALHHKRRYNIKELKEKISEVNLEIKKISYIYSFIFIPVILLRLFRKVFGKEIKSDPFEKTPKFINNLFIKIEKIEAEIFKRINLPFGISIVCLARKR